MTEAPTQPLPMTPEEAKPLVAPYIFRVSQYAAISHGDALALLGEDRLSRLTRDPIRKLGPTPETIYPWNVQAYLEQPTLGAKLTAAPPPA